MKIAIIQGAFFPVPAILGGAVEKIWFRMGQEFSALGHEVIHIGRSHPSLQKKEIINGVTYNRIKGYDTPSSKLKLKYLDFLYSMKAIKEIPKNIDIIVTNTFWSPFLLRGTTGKKVYVSVERYPKWQMKFYTHVGKLRGCSPVICKAIKSELPPKHHHLITYVPNPVPFNIHPIECSKEKVILYVGRLHPEKGLHILLKAFSTFQQVYNAGWKLIIVGPHTIHEGGGGDLYFQQLKNLGHGFNVAFVGPIYEEKELIKYYSRASIFCYPAQQGSGDAAPVAPREAMAYGCVPIVSQLACFDDFIIDGKNGLRYNHLADDQYFELYKLFKMMINDENLLLTLSNNARDIITTYSSQLIAQQFIKDFTTYDQTK